MEVSKEQIRRIENGTSDGTATRVFALARTLGISLDYLSQRSEPRDVAAASLSPGAIPRDAYEQARSAFAAGDLERAFGILHHLHQLLVDAPASHDGDDWLPQRVSISLATVAYRLKRPELAQGLLADALRRADMPAKLRVQALETWTVVLHALKQLLAAEMAGRRATKEAEELREPYLIGASNRNLANVFWEQGDFRSALKHYATAAVTFEAMGEDVLKVQARALQGACLVRICLQGQGLEVLRSAVQSSRRLGDPVAHAFCEHVLADTCLFLADREPIPDSARVAHERRAGRLYERCYRVYDSTDSWDLMLASGWRLYQMRRRSPRRRGSAANYLETLKKLVGKVNPSGLAAQEYRALIEHLGQRE